MAGRAAKGKRQKPPRLRERKIFVTPECFSKAERVAYFFFAIIAELKTDRKGKAKGVRSHWARNTE
jgi:hypothetical protein